MSSWHLLNAVLFAAGADRRKNGVTIRAQLLRRFEESLERTGETLLSVRFFLRGRGILLRLLRLFASSFQIDFALLQLLENLRVLENLHHAADLRLRRLFGDIERFHVGGDDFVASELLFLNDGRAVDEFGNRLFLRGIVFAQRLDETGIRGYFLRRFRFGFRRGFRGGFLCGFLDGHNGLFLFVCFVVLQSLQNYLLGLRLITFIT